ncbi:DUF192 domain-containing protein [Rhodohalobacter halophilus]|uniref:DUF192 domain-containing protein n=1 Tax=Rhodohalobacter halophilus TaxID=1812810 RepID=UPI00083F8F05|nr:DUF192 domain-containing protein [Rhodohalobacter halophilus]
MFKFITSILFVSLLITACGEESPRNEQTTETRQLDYTADVAFINSAGEEVTSIRAAVADDDHSRSEGLMNVHNLPSDAGMIFIFDEDAPRSFWMANTPISLDIIYVNSEMEIVRIHRNTPPYSHENIRSEAPAKYVVEVNAGYTMEHDITEGMMIQLTRQ